MDDIVRLRRAERIPEAAAEVAPVRRGLESQLGPSLSRSRAAGILGVSQTALDRWVDAGQVPVVVTPGGRREVPGRFVLELREAIDGLRRAGQRRHVLAAALTARREAAEGLGGGRPGPYESVPPQGHGTAERRSRVYHQIVADRLGESMLEEAREAVERLATAGRLHPRYAERWRELLGRPRDEVARALSADTQEARDLRQNSPFAGVLNEQERRQIIETTR